MVNGYFLQIYKFFYCTNIYRRSKPLKISCNQLLIPFTNILCYEQDFWTG
jgi:hypothetical protein